MMDLQGVLEEVKQLAVEVGTFISKQRETFDLSRVESKHSHDYVSYVDKESEKMIVARLKEILPVAGFITEEKTTEQKDAPYCVSIALRNEKEFLLGVVYEVTRKELYSAFKGGGAYLNGRKIHVSSFTDMDKALVMIGYPYNAEGYRRFCMNLSGQLYGHCASIRSNGSAEAELCYLAAGKIDVYVESFIQPWDVAAGACILMEAGGKVTDYEGKNELWESGREVLDTNGMLHEAMLKEISRARD